MGYAMITLVVLAMTLLGGTTWLALDQPVTRHPELNRKMTAAGLLLCLVAVVAVFASALVISP
ncbi:hypothetical protein [Actinoplanes sp. NPDC049118]|uniref:hypothetical protein n=1 Tax=Actinoplanes sp. NPDC049118 TaxID=3155769 RepID=UPI0033F9B48E